MNAGDTMAAGYMADPVTELLASIKPENLFLHQPADHPRISYPGISKRFQNARDFAAHLSQLNEGNDAKHG
jgi:hypothetical protein